MAPRFTAHFALTLAAAFLTFPACSDSGSTAGQFSAALVASPPAAVAASAAPAAACAASVPAANVTLFSLSRTGCPTTQPFLTHMTLVLGPLQNDFFMD